VQMVSEATPAILQHVQSGRLKALAVTSARRIPALPGVPTLKESGVDAEISGWYGFLAPAATPAAQPAAQPAAATPSPTPAVATAPQARPTPRPAARQPARRPASRPASRPAASPAAAPAAGPQPYKPAAADAQPRQTVQ